MSNIEWTDSTWNPVIGCTPVSPGCLNCYAATMANRMQHMPQVPEYHPRSEELEQGRAYEINRAIDDSLAAGRGEPDDNPREIRIAKIRGGRAVFTGDVRCLPDRLGEPLKWKKPRRVFVCSMSDLFHPSVPDEFIRLVFAVMSYCGQHTFQVLTKRPDRMAAWFADEANSLSACQAEYCIRFAAHDPAMTPTGKSRVRDTRSINGTRKGLGDGNYWPLPNVWLGTSVEDQKRADERIPHLLRCPAAVRFLSCEPLLGDVRLTPEFGPSPIGQSTVIHNRVNWIIVGGESGPGARPCEIGWIRSVVRQAKSAGVACFVKQLGAFPISDGPLPMLKNHADGDKPRRWPSLDPKGGDPSEWPNDLRVREWPEVKP